MKNSPEKYEILGHPTEWVQYANELFEASEILIKEKDNSILIKTDSDGKTILKKSGISRSYFLLIGFALENLMKGYIISRNPNFVKNGKIEKSISSNHNLFELSKKINEFMFSKSEIDLFKTLTEGIPYWTRYPIPKRFENITEEKILSGETRKIFTELFDKLEIAIYIYENRNEKVWLDTKLEKRLE